MAEKVVLQSESSLGEGVNLAPCRLGTKVVESGAVGPGSRGAIPGPQTARHLPGWQRVERRHLTTHATGQVAQTRWRLPLAEPLWRGGHNAE